MILRMLEHFKGNCWSTLIGLTMLNILLYIIYLKLSEIVEKTEKSTHNVKADEKLTSCVVALSKTLSALRILIKEQNINCLSLFIRPFQRANELTVLLLVYPKEIESDNKLATLSAN